METIVIDWEAVRGWLQLTVVGVGGVIALGTYLSNQRQRRFENGLRAIAAFRAAVSDDDLRVWQRILDQASGPPYAAGALAPSAEQYPFGALLVAEGEEAEAVNRILEALNLSSHELLKGYADLEVFYAELGEVMTSVYRAFGDLHHVVPGVATRAVLDMFYPQFARLYRKNIRQFAEWPHRSLAVLAVQRSRPAA